MVSGHKMPRWAKRTVCPAIFSVLAAYFILGATLGTHGLMAASQHQAFLQQAQQDKAEAQKEHDDWARRVEGFKSKHLDRDLIDQQVRSRLDKVDPSDIVVRLAPHKETY